MVMVKLRIFYRNTLGKAMTFITNKIDEVRGLDFAGEVMNDGIVWGAPSTLRVRYVVSKYFGKRITNNDSIIDIGCGKGKMLTFFYKYNFKRICGLEYVKESVDIAKKNLKRLGIGGVSVIHGDASQYRELDEFNYFYMSNPFQDDNIMYSFIRNINISLERKYRKIHIIYNNPTQAEILLNEGLVIEKEMPIYMNTKVIIYTNVKNTGDR